LDRASARQSLKRYAPAAGPAVLTVAVEQPDGSTEVIYRGSDPGGAPKVD
jgi:hypothetical protein